MFFNNQAKFYNCTNICIREYMEMHHSNTSFLLGRADQATQFVVAYFSPCQNNKAHYRVLVEISNQFITIQAKQLSQDWVAYSTSVKSISISQLKIFLVFICDNQWRLEGLVYLRLKMSQALSQNKKVSDLGIRLNILMEIYFEREYD